jgi:hypothetical protein
MSWLSWYREEFDSIINIVISGSRFLKAGHPKKPTGVPLRGGLPVRSNTALTNGATTSNWPRIFPFRVGRLTAFILYRFGLALLLSNCSLFRAVRYARHDTLGGAFPLMLGRYRRPTTIVTGIFLGGWNCGCHRRHADSLGGLETRLWEVMFCLQGAFQLQHHDSSTLSPCHLAASLPIGG